MATVVQYEYVIDAENQRTPGAGVQAIRKASCPDLYALTLATSDPDERMLPLGWRVQFLTDSATGTEKGTLLKAPDGRTWNPENCTLVQTAGKAGNWSWLAGAGLFGIMAYLLTRKK